MFGVTVPGPHRRQEEKRSGYEWVSFAAGGGGWAYSTGGSASLEQTLRVPAAYACMDVLVDNLSSTPFDAIRLTSDGYPSPVTPKPSLLVEPSGLVTVDVWRSQLAFSQVSDGNAFGLITSWTGYPLPSTVEWLDPGTVSERKVYDGIAQVKVGGKVHQLFPHGDILHIPGRMVPPGTVFALSPLEYAMNPTRIAAAAEQFSLGWFTAEGHPTKHMTVAGDPTREQLAQMSSDYENTLRTRKPWWTGEGIVAEDLGSAPDVTVLSIQQQAVLDMCRVWHVPPNWVYAAITGQQVTYANVSQSDVDGLKRTLDGYLVRSEHALTRCLPQPQIVIANRDAALRVDALTRWDINLKKLQAFGASVNEVRVSEGDRPWDDPKFDLPGLPGGSSAPAPQPPEAGNGTDTKPL